MMIFLFVAVIAAAAEYKFGARRRKSAALASKMAGALATAEVAVADALFAFAAEPSEENWDSVSRAQTRLVMVREAMTLVAPK